MMDLTSPIRRGLRGDIVLLEVLGKDADNEVKVYDDPAKSDVSPPYATFAVMSTNQQVGVYGDDYVIEPFPLLLKAWGRDPREAWSIAEFLEDALFKADFAYDPYEVIRIRRVSTPEQLPDRDTDMTQVVMTYDVILAR